MIHFLEGVVVGMVGGGTLVYMFAAKVITETRQLIGALKAKL